MNLRSPQSSRVSAFSLVEIMIVSSILVVVLAAMMVFTELTAKSALGITTQSTLNQKASFATQLLQARVSLCVGMTNSTNGYQLWLAFDDAPDTDANSDGTTYNDTNHWECFAFENPDGAMGTYKDNRLVYFPNTSNTNVNMVLLKEGIRPLPGTNMFLVRDVSRVSVNIGVLDPYDLDQTQMIEIKTVGLSRNTPK